LPLMPLPTFKRAGMYAGEWQPRWWTVVVVVTGLVASLTVAACGGARATAPVTPPPQLAASPNLITTDDINTKPVSTPERTVLEWAQAIQFSDPRTVLSLYTPEAIADGGRRRIEDAVLDIGASLGRPEFVQVDAVEPKLERVRGFLVSYDANRAPVYRQPVTLNLVLRADGWKLNDATVLLRTHADLIRQRGQQASADSSAPVR
jgi:hypothetical protein